MVNNFEKLAFKTKIMSILGVISVLALLQIGFMAYNSKRFIIEDKRKLLGENSSSWLDKIDRNLFERYGDVQAFALSEPARSGVPSRIVSFMDDMMGAYAPIYDLMIVVNSKGKVVAVNTVGKDGKKIDSSGLLGKDYSQEEWFKKGMSDEVKPGSTFVEDLHADADVKAVAGTDGQVMNFTAPIRDKDSGKILGIWTNRMSWADVVLAITNDELKKLKAAHGSASAYLMDGTGKYLVHPSGETFIGKESYPGFEASKKALTGQSYLSVDLEEDLKGFKGTAVGGFTASAGFSSYAARGWHGILSVPKADAEGTFANWMVFIAFTLQVLGWVVGWFVANRLGLSFLGVMKELRKEAEEVSSAAGEIHGSSKNIATASTGQASALQETASAIEEISAMIKKSADNATRSTEVAVNSQNAVQRGKESVIRVVGAIEEISQSNDAIMAQVEDSNRQITEIVKVITEIGAKTKVINDIVFQTKLLSFNASVEAARAGEHGKGFAVVAEEVGNLAQMSGNAAKEIGDMLNGSIQKVEGIVDSTKKKVEGLITDGRKKVETGKIVAQECGTVLDEVVQNVSEVNQMVGEITTASHEQATGVAEITKAMNQLDQATHENAAAAENAANSANGLSQRADVLFEVVATLQHLVQGYHLENETTRTRQEPAARSHGNEPTLSRKVVPFPTKATEKAGGPGFKQAATPSIHVAMVSGGAPEIEVPAQDDPRFKEF